MGRATLTPAKIRALEEAKRRFFAGARRKAALKALSVEARAQRYLDGWENFRDFEQGVIEVGDVYER